MGELHQAERGGSVTVRNAGIFEAIAIGTGVVLLTAAIFENVEGGDDTHPDEAHERNTPEHF